MKITLKTFGILSDIIPPEIHDLEHPIRTGKFIGQLKKQHPSLGSLSFLAFVNGEIQPDQQELKDRDELVLVPLFAGG